MKVSALHLMLLVFLGLAAIGSDASAEDPAVRKPRSCNEATRLLRNSIRMSEGAQLNQEQEIEAVLGIEYLTGVMEGIFQSQIVSGKEWIDFPDEGGLIQYARVVLKFMEDRPEKLHLPASPSVFLAFVKAFPGADASEVVEKAR